jgi:hypothetical protein
MHLRRIAPAESEGRRAIRDDVHRITDGILANSGLGLNNSSVTRVLGNRLRK